jgi:hypothetical protein
MSQYQAEMIIKWKKKFVYLIFIKLLHIFPNLI